MGAGALVAFGDINKERGEEIAEEFGPKVVFVPGDVRNWEDQKALFNAALRLSPSNAIDIVFANAGITGGDDNFEAEPDENGEPLEPDLTCIDINLKAVLYTVKLAMHYWREPPKEGQDRSLILTASLAGYWDHTGKTQYGATKWAVRGIMSSTRSKGTVKGFRTNLIAPWSVTPFSLHAQGSDGLQNRKVHSDKHCFTGRLEHHPRSVGCYICRSG